MGHEIKKIYSAVDASEVARLLEVGYVVRGYFSDNVADLKTKEAQMYPIHTLTNVLGGSRAARFESDKTSHQLFALVKVIKEIEVRGEDLEKLGI